MGAWNTLHLFDADRFYQEGIPRLINDRDAIKDDYLDFLTSFRVGGISTLTSRQLEKLLDESTAFVQYTAQQLDDTFRVHRQYNTITDWDERRAYLDKNDAYYAFNGFFEYYIFKYYADFYPHLSCGKHGLYPKLGAKPMSVAEELIGTLEDDSTYFCADRIGIINWLSSEETAFLWQCKEDFFPKGDMVDITNNFFDVVEIAATNNLGLIRGIDMREHILERLPSYKLVEKKQCQRDCFILE